MTVDHVVSREDVIWAFGFSGQIRTEDDLVTEIAPLSPV